MLRSLIMRCWEWYALKEEINLELIKYYYYFLLVLFLIIILFLLNTIILMDN